LPGWIKATAGFVVAHGDVIISVSAVGCTVITGGACAPLAAGAVLANIGYSAHRNLGGSNSHPGRFAVDVVINVSTFGAANLARRAVTPFYMASSGDRAFASHAIEPTIFIFQMTTDQARDLFNHR
jgi:hypothetical protein